MIETDITQQDPWVALWALILPHDAQRMLAHGAPLAYVLELYPFENKRYDVQYRLLDVIMPVTADPVAWAAMGKLYKHAYALAGAAPWDTIEELEKFGFDRLALPKISEGDVADALLIAPWHPSNEVSSMDAFEIQHLVLCLGGWLLFADKGIRDDPSNQVFTDYAIRFLRIVQGV